MHTVTVAFSNLEDARWFQKMAQRAADRQDRLGRCDAAIMQDSLARSAGAELREDTKPSRQPSNT